MCCLVFFIAADGAVRGFWQLLRLPRSLCPRHLVLLYVLPLVVGWGVSCSIGRLDVHFLLDLLMETWEDFLEVVPCVALLFLLLRMGLCAASIL